MIHKATKKPNQLMSNSRRAGCASKLSASDLNQIVRSLSSLPCQELLAGINNFEDAAVYRLTPELAIIETVDFFPPVVDDPFLYGQIAATNALSDVYAMGGRPILALNVFSFPVCEYPITVAEEILKGGAFAIAQAGATLAGGHSIQGSEPLYGLAVTGVVHPQRMLTNSGAIEGDLLVLSKPIGVGVGLLGLKGNILSTKAQQDLFKSLTSLNDKALELALHHNIHAATDITGFGLIGHLHELAYASKLAVALWSGGNLFLPETYELAQQGIVPNGAYSNRKSFSSFLSNIDELDTATSDLLFDPQTSGGLLFALAEKEAHELVCNMLESDIQAQIIGSLHTGVAGMIEVIMHDS